MGVYISWGNRVLQQTVSCLMLRWNLTLVLRRNLLLLAVCAFGAASSVAQAPSGRYALILEDPPAIEKMSSRADAQSAQTRTYQQQVLARQRSLKTQLNSRNIQVLGSVSTVLNAVFVRASESRLAELRALPGVKGITVVRKYKLNLNKADQLINAPTAWNAVGGVQNAGAGIKIAILDSGIEQSHPAFQDSSLPMPSGYPICSGSDCAFTTNKVIVARSYVKMLAGATDPINPATSRPDDYSPRDHSGHGTAVASCAAAVSTSAAVTFNGVAPKAYLGNYKIYGSPQVNDFVTDDVIVTALEDAYNDGMDIISFSTGGPALSGPLDVGDACGNPSGIPCDLSSTAFEQLANRGVIIVAAAGNDGDTGFTLPTFNTIESPGAAPSVITVGATTNAHTFGASVSVPGGPSNLRNVAGVIGDSMGGFGPVGALAAPLRDAGQVGDVFACSAFPTGSLTGTFALIEQSLGNGGCVFFLKTQNAVAAGAAGIIFYTADSTEPFELSALDEFEVPVIMVSNANGLALKTFANANPGRQAIIDPAGIEQNVSGNRLIYFSSLGPTTGTAALKPDLVAPGFNIFMATQSFDPLGDLYSSTGFIDSAGTSFATPIVSGVAALVKQKHPNWDAAKVKSALVNTASQDILTDDDGNPVTVQWIGAGKVDAGAAINSTITIAPPTLSFGSLTTESLPKSQALTLTNTGAASVTLNLGVAIGNQSSAAAVSLDKTSLTIPAGASDIVTVELTGTRPAPGSYYGAITLQGTGVTLRVPYLYLVAEGIANNIIPTPGADPATGDNFDGIVGQPLPEGIFVKVLDQYGLPVANAPVTFTATGGGSFQTADSRTDAYGFAYAVPVLGSMPGRYFFTFGATGRLRYTFVGVARQPPTISASAVVDAASFLAGGAVAPGSYITLFGSGLSDSTGTQLGTRLPPGFRNVSVSFDVPSSHISAPGHIVFVSPTQVNVQVPWELQGQNAAQVKVTIHYSPGNVITVPLSDYAPGFFEGTAGAVAALDASYRIINASNPAQRGQTVSLFANGLGPVNNQPASGDPAPSSPLATTKVQPNVTIGGQNAPVSFSGLAPGFAGLYQLNVTVPSGIGAGNQPLVVTIGGKTSKTSGIVVQ